MRKQSRMALTLAVLVIGLKGQAVAILTNLPPTNDGISDNVFGAPGGFSYGVTTGSTAYNLTSMSVRLLQTQNGARPSLVVYSNASNNPGTVLFSGFTTPVFTDNVVQTYTFTATSSFVLAANTGPTCLWYSRAIGLPSREEADYALPLSLAR